MHILVCIVTFMATYLISLTYVSVFYHRGFAHGAVKLRPWLERFSIRSGPWVTGIDPVGWACMHRLHHQYSDTAQDPHSPVNSGPWRVLLTQLQSYKRVLVRLIKKDVRYTSIVSDLPYEVGALSRSKMWKLPYLVHAIIAVILSNIGYGPLLGAAYFFGITSHPFQGWMVNSIGHLIGTRNFNIEDNSQNNTVVAILALGEGYQNNHHRYPASAKFSYRSVEVDLGYGICRIMHTLGLLTINKEKLIPAAINITNRAPEPANRGNK